LTGGARLVGLSALIVSCSSGHAAPNSPAAMTATVTAPMSKPPVETPPASSGACSGASIVSIEDSGQEAKLDDDTVTEVAFRGDLNSDGILDLIVQNEESASSYGELEHSVYVGCGGDRFALVYGPEYSIQLEPEPEAGAAEQGFLRLRELRRTGTASDPEAERALLRYENGRYRQMEVHQVTP
jgi:hypothetical protein